MVIYFYKDVLFEDVWFKDVLYKDVLFDEVWFKDVLYKDVLFEDVWFKDVLYKDVIFDDDDIQRCVFVESFKGVHLMSHYLVFMHSWSIRFKDVI